MISTGFNTMKHGASVLIFILFAILQACDNFSNSEIESAVQERVYKGYYIYGHEANTFQPCGQQTVYWVNGPTDVLDILQRNYNENTSRPYEEVFVELTGNIAGKASDGFAMDYDGQFSVLKLLSMKKKSKNDCNQ